MFGTLAAWTVRYRAFVAVGLLVVVGGLGAGMYRLRVDFTFTAFVGSNDPEYKFLLHTLERWERGDQTLLVLVECEDCEERALLEPEPLAALERALTAVERLDGVATAAGLPRLPWPDESMPGVLSAKPVRESAPTAPAARAAWQKRVLADPGFVPALLSEDGRRSMLITRLSIDVDDILNVRPTVLAVRDALAPLQGQASLRYYVAGIPSVRADLVELIATDTFTLAAFGALFILLALTLLFRSLHGVLIPVAATLLPAVMLLGLMGWAGEPIGLLSQAFATLIPAIAAADAIHVLSRFHEEIGVRLADGTPFSAELRDEAIVAAMKRVGTACLFTSLTTAVGFGSLMLADMRALQRFGLYAAIGIGFAFLTMVIAVPLLLGAVGRTPRTSVRAPGWVDQLLGATARFAVVRPVAILVVSAGVIAGSLALGAGVEVNNWLSDNLTPGHPTQVANNIIDEHLAGSIPGNVHVTTSGNVLDPQVLAAFDETERALREHGTVRTVLGPATILRRVNASISGTDALPDSRALAEQLLLLSGAEEQLEAVLAVDRKSARILFQLPDVGAKGYRTFVRELRPVIADGFASSGATAKMTGLSHVAYLAINRLVGELVVSLLFALVFIALILGLLFKSVKVSLVAMVPNCAPLVVCLGAMGALGWELNPTSALVFTVGLGIAVDDTIHLLARVHGAPPDWTTARALEAAVQSTGRALVVTTVVLLGGFGLLGLSAFRINRFFGALSAIAIGGALVFDLLALPALLTLTGRAGTRR